jgi:hypothetical protein
MGELNNSFEGTRPRTRIEGDGASSQRKEGGGGEDNEEGVTPTPRRGRRERSGHYIQLQTDPGI